MISLKGKVVLITGAGSGLGQSHAHLLSKMGADIIINDINNEGAEATAELVKLNQRSSYIVISDVLDKERLHSGISDATGALGTVNVLVNNAGISSLRLPFEEITKKILSTMMDINVKGAFYATEAVLPEMKKRRDGKIINTSSIHGMTGAGAGSHYAAAKAAILGLTKAWAKEFAPWNILVNAVAPGYIPTPMTLRPGNEMVRTQRTKTIPLGHEGDPIDISNAVAYFASEQGNYVTGQVLSPNGGIVIV